MLKICKYLQFSSWLSLAPFSAFKIQRVLFNCFKMVST